ncbi:MAG: hypothetical protein ACYS0G_07935 [Planctomycetota bacterium]|jgi:hypothetical protein
MRKLMHAVAALGVLLGFGAPFAHGQKATEMFIPIGRSPGLSGKYTIIGRLETVNPLDRVITIAGPAQTWRATATSRTLIWLDRSKFQLTNLYGDLEDLRQGLVVEVKYEDPKRRGSGTAEWIKCSTPRPTREPVEEVEFSQAATTPAPAGLPMGFGWSPCLAVQLLGGPQVAAGRWPAGSGPV